jgi:hypothetical protein
MKKIAAGFCYRTMSPTEFIISMLKLWDTSPEVREGGMIFEPFRHDIFEARNKMVDEFLKMEGVDHLFMVDTDMVFEPQDFRTLVEHDAPVVSGAAINSFDRLDAFVETPGGLQQVMANPLPTEPGAVDFVGAGFMLVQREVFEKIGDEWFDHVTYGGRRLSEDYSFCLKAREAGFPILLDPAVRVGHVKVVTITPGDKPFGENQAI